MGIEYLQIESKDTRYAYATGRLRGLEVYLLKEGDFVRLKEAADAGEILQVLSKMPLYSDSMKGIEREEDFEKGLEEELKRTYRQLRSFCPEPDLVDLFWLEYDFHNLKVLFKIRFQKNLAETAASELEKNLSPSGTQNIEILKRAVLSEDFSDLSPDLKSIVQESFSSIAKSPHPQIIDSLLDKKLFKYLVLKLAKYSDPFLEELIRRQIDYFNITAFLRVKFWGMEDTRGFLEKILMDEGTVDKKKLLELANQPANSLREMLQATDYGKAIDEALREWENEHSFFSLDRFFEEYILSYTKRGFYVTFGREPLVNYIFLKKREIKVLRGILRGKLARLSEDKMEKYLPSVQ